MDSKCCFGGGLEVRVTLAVAIRNFKLEVERLLKLVVCPNPFDMP